MGSHRAEVTYKNFTIVSRNRNNGYRYSMTLYPAQFVEQGLGRRMAGRLSVCPIDRQQQRRLPLSAGATLIATGAVLQTPAPGAQQQMQVALY